LIAWDENEAMGCVGLRPTDVPEIGELKRLYVRPTHRGKKAGTGLCSRIINRARKAGYTTSERLPLDAHCGNALDQIPRFTPVLLSDSERIDEVEVERVL